jgi:NDP-sugar pyrophosphorylase family protein
MALLTSRKIKQVPLLDEEGRVVGLELLDNLLASPQLKENPAIILAGGQGTRLRPLTNDSPKPLLMVGGRSVLELIVQQLRAYGFHRLFISVNYMGSRIEERFGDGKHYDVSIQYLRELEPLGTAGPLSLMPMPQDLPCVVVNGDLLTTVSFEHMLEFHREGGFSLTTGVKEYSFQLSFGVVETKGDRVVDFQEKPTEARLINAGVYVLDPKVLELVPRGRYYDMSNLIEDMIGRPDTPVGAFMIHEYWMDIGTPDDYQRAQQDYHVLFPLESRLEP